MFQFSINAVKFKCKKLLGKLSLWKTRQHLRREEEPRPRGVRAEQCLLELVWWDTFGRYGWDNTDQGHVPWARRTGITSFPKTFSLEVLSW